VGVIKLQSAAAMQIDQRGTGAAVYIANAKTVDVDVALSEDAAQHVDR
jgi:hypothetical protein